MASPQDPAADRPVVLIVDDDPGIRTVFAAALDREGYRVVMADGSTSARGALQAQQVDLVLLDVEMPDGSGFDLARTIRADPGLEGMGIIFVTGEAGLDSRVAGLGLGANDYLVKPVQLEELLARVGAHLRARSRWLERLEQQLAARSRLARRIADLDPGVPLLLLERQLLGILNGQLDLAALRITTRADVPAGSATTELTVAGRGAGVTVGVPLRFGGALIGVLSADVEGQADQAISTLNDLAPQIGAVVADSITRRDSTELARRWVDELGHVGHLAPVYQPIVSLADERVQGFEGLSRFADGTPPAVAFARAAAAGVGVDLELMAIERLLAGATTLADGAWLSLNVSATSLLHGDVGSLLESTDRPLVLEVTEHEHVKDYASVRDRLAELPGVRLAVDDAGAGYASLRHIFELRPDLIKLDRGWIADIDRDRVREALVSGLISFASSFGAVIVAEGVERREEADLLCSLGVPLGQGYLFGRPAPATPAA